MKQAALATVIGLLLGGLPQVATAQGMMGSMQGRGGMMSQDQLTPQQRDRAQQIYRQSRPRIAQLRQMIVGKKFELSALTMTPDVDDKRVQSLITEIGGLEEQLLQAEVSMQRQLSQAGIPTHGLGMGMMGSGSGSCPMMQGSCPMMQGGGEHHWPMGNGD